jgi:hypothetical protein
LSLLQDEFSAIKLLVAYRLFASESLENHRNT